MFELTAEEAGDFAKEERGILCAPLREPLRPLRLTISPSVAFELYKNSGERIASKHYA